MKTTFLLAAMLAIFTHAVSGQLVHLTLEGTVSDQFGGESWWEGGESGVGESATLHVYYDPGLPVALADPAIPEASYTSNSAANNFWRLSFGTVDVSSPFHTIRISDTGMAVESFHAPSFTSLDLRLVFASDPSAGFALPATTLPALAATDPMNPFDTNPSRFVFDTQNGFGLEAGSLYVDLETLRVENLPRFQAVPEPSTYAAAAALLLLGVVTWRRRRVAGA